MLQEIIEKIYIKNMQKLEIYLKQNKKPKIAIINTNLKDEPTQRYIRNKIKKCNEYNISTIVVEPKNREELISEITKLNQDNSVTSIILQYPLSSNIISKNTQEFFDLIDPVKDIDKLNSCWYYSKNPEDLPLTSNAIYEMIKELKHNKVLFYGNGITTNRRLFLKMFDEGQKDCRIINSKTPMNSKKELIEWSEIIVSAIGKKDSLNCENKIIICPSIIKNEDGTFSSDIVDPKKNQTHKVIGGIGKLTVSKLLLRAYELCNSL